jgi:hypothetical protein
MASDLFSTLRVYLSKISEGDHNPSEVVAALNTWLRDSGESIKVKVEEEVERSVKKMGFVKQADFDRLVKEVDALRNAATVQKPSVRSSAKKAVKKTAPSSPKKSAVKSATAKAKTKKVAPAKVKK